MKAKIKATGEPVEVVNFYNDGTVEFSNGGYALAGDVDIDFACKNDIDWDRVRIDASVSIVTKLASDTFTVGLGKAYKEAIAKHVVSYADILINELKSKQEDEARI